MNSNIFVITGKGGVGKTSISAAFVRILRERFPDKRVLAIDADPATGLSTALGLVPKLTLDGIRKHIAHSIEQGDTAYAIELLSEAKFHMLDAIVEKENISFIAIGRPESAGCYCKVNAYLKEVVTSLSENFDFVIIDGEAGIEQVNRRVVEEFTNLILVSDASKKGIGVINTIKNVAEELASFKNCGIIFNRIPDSFSLGDANTFAPVLAYIGNDPQQTEFDMLGKTVFEINENSVLLTGAKAALDILLR